MSLYHTIQEAYMAAFKNKEIIKKDILNYVFSQLKNKKIDSQRELTDDEVIQILKKEIKARQEAVGFARQAGKNEEATLDEAKIEIIVSFLPKQFSEEELRTLVQQTIITLQITDLSKQRGQLI